MAVSKEVLEKMRIARCADICDALDSMGLQDRYEMCLEMRPLFPGIRFCGIAHTQEYVRTDQRMPYLAYEEFDRLQYTVISEGGYHFMKTKDIPGYNGGKDEVLVIDAKGARAGVLGSENTLNLFSNGVVGFVIDGTFRDSPESIMQKAPGFCTVRSYTHPQGRLHIHTDNQPIVCGGVVVRPGDIVAGDDDGIIVVPQDIAAEVADRAYKIQAKDRVARRATYAKLGIPFDKTVELLP